MRARSCSRVASLLAASRREEGQSLVVIAVSMVVFLGMLGLGVDVGQLYIMKNKLQTAADAAALSGAAQLSSSPGTATATAVSYDGTGSNKNAVAGYTVTTTTALGCLSRQTLGTSYISCTPNTAPNTAFSPACTSNCDAIKVTESTSVSPLLLGLLGIGSTTVSASAVAAESGGVPQPLDVEMIVDTTASMGGNDTCTLTSVSRPTQEDCAKEGVATLLDTLLPCAQSLTSCGTATSDNVPNPVDRVGLMVFPALTGVSAGTGTGVPAETNCTNGEISHHVTYSLNTNFFNNYSNYQVVPFSSDYRTSDTASSSDANNPGLALNANSPLANAIYWDQCPGAIYPGDESYGVEDPGGVSTFYGDVITEAQAAFTANGRSSASGVSDAIVLLSDGDANSSSMTGSSDPTGKNECQAAISAAEAAERAGTLVFTVAYGALTSGCSTDSGSPSSSPANYSAESPLCTLVMMADNSVSNPSQYSNDTAALAGAESEGCNSNANMASDPTHHFFNTPDGSTLQANFQSVGNALTGARLVSGNAT